MDFGHPGHRDTTYLLAGIRECMRRGMPVWRHRLVHDSHRPPLHIGLLIYLYLPLSLGRRPPAFVAAMRPDPGDHPWSMLEIFCSVCWSPSVKLAEQATIVAGPAAWSLGLLVIVLAAAATQIHPHRLWDLVA